jgi:ubiquinone/menaquinone biosynthesis C-methylase UbiE
MLQISTGLRTSGLDKDERPGILFFMSHDKHQHFFDSLAAEWDLMFTAEDLERLAHIVDRLSVKEGMNILDLGCGTGILFDMLRRKVGQNGSVTGVDFSIKMAQKAYRNFPFANVNVVDADAIMLPFGDSTFDMAVAFSAFPHFSDQQKAIDETHRVLKPKARFYIIHLISSKELSLLHHEIGGIVEGDEIPPEARLREMLNTSKFSDVAIEDHPGLYLTSAVNSK